MATSAQSEQSPPATHEPRVRLNLPVFIGSASGVLIIALWAMIAREDAETTIGTVVTWVGANFGWYYFLITAVVLVFVVVVALSRVGRTRLGPEHSRPQFNLFTWSAMLFAAGIGIDLMFFSVAEPVTQYLMPPTGEAETPEAARQALVWTLFHYGLVGWALYALMGMALAYFSYRHNLPLSIRSALYPLFGKRIEGWPGHIVDVAALLGAIFGIATSLGIGVVQLNYGLFLMFGWAEGPLVQVGLIVFAVAVATFSVVSGVDKGIRRLSELNVILAILLMLYILFLGRTNYLLDGIVQNTGDTLARLPGMLMDTFAYVRGDEIGVDYTIDAWLGGWTLFFWAWWIAWAPFVGLFLARISRGRTIRQFVIGTMTVPFAFILLWISIFGNSALDIVRGGNAEFGEAAMNTPERAFYGLLEQYPGAGLIIGIATFTGLLFYVTSADSGSLVMSNFTSKLPDADSDGAKWLRVFWSVATGVLTFAMLLVDGVATLQNATIIMGLPLSVLLIFIMLGLLKAFRLENRLSDSFVAALPSRISSRSAGGGAGRNWRNRLARVMSYPSARQANRFVDEVVEPALREVHDELARQGAEVSLTDGTVEAYGIRQVDLRVGLSGERSFKYQVYPVQYEYPSYARTAPAQEVYYRMEVFSQEGSHHYDLTGYSTDQVISDVLDHYEAYLEFLHLGRETPGTSLIGEEGSDKGDWESDFPGARTEGDATEPRDARQ